MSSRYPFNESRVAKVTSYSTNGSCCNCCESMKSSLLEGLAIATNAAIMTI